MVSDKFTTLIVRLAKFTNSAVDPLDKRYLYLATSIQKPHAGQGAFAKENVPPSTVFSLSSGLFLDADELKQTMRMQHLHNAVHKIRPTDPRALAKWKYRQSHSVCKLTIDLPPEYEDHLAYNATLGHKVNHSFLPTTHYHTIDSARFGPINSVRTFGIGGVDAGEEFWVNYHYKLDKDLPWYTRAFRDFAEEHPDLANNYLRSFGMKSLEDLPSPSDNVDN